MTKLTYGEARRKAVKVSEQVYFYPGDQTTSRAYSNSCIIRGDRQIIIDPGPLSEDRFEELEFLAEEDGLKMEDTEEVWLTHAHSDHTSLATLFSQKFNSRVRCHPLARIILEASSPLNYFLDKEIKAFAKDSFIFAHMLDGLLEELAERLKNTFFQMVLGLPGELRKKIKRTKKKKSLKLLFFSLLCPPFLIIQTLVCFLCFLFFRILAELVKIDTNFTKNTFLFFFKRFSGIFHFLTKMILTLFFRNWPSCFVQQVFEADEIVSNNPDIQIHFLAGHVPEESGFYLEQEKILIIGDLINGGEKGKIKKFPMLVSPGSSGLEVALDSIQRIKRMGAEILIPAHGEIIQGREKIISLCEEIGAETERIRQSARSFVANHPNFSLKDLINHTNSEFPKFFSPGQKNFFTLAILKTLELKFER